MKGLSKYGLFLFGLILLIQSLPGQTLTVQVRGIRSTEGVLRVSLFTNSQEFSEEAPRYEIVAPKTDMHAGQRTVTFLSLPPGTYGIAVLDDKNENGKMDYRWIKPVEGYGFSDFHPRKLRKPAFDKFQFSLHEKNKTVCVNMVYW